LPGITNTSPQQQQQMPATAMQTNVTNMNTTKFVSKILFSKTKVFPKVRHALTFRHSVAWWTNKIEAMKMELATLRGKVALGMQIMFLMNRSW
jgi:hypothetical protein